MFESLFKFFLTHLPNIHKSIITNRQHVALKKREVRFTGKVAPFQETFKIDVNQNQMIILFAIYSLKLASFFKNTLLYVYEWSAAKNSLSTYVC